MATRIEVYAAWFLSHPCYDTAAMLVQYMHDHADMETVRAVQLDPLVRGLAGNAMDLYEAVRIKNSLADTVK